MEKNTDYGQQILDMAEIPDCSPDPDPMPYLMMPIESIVNTPQNQLRELAVSAGREIGHGESFILQNFIRGLLFELGDMKTMAAFDLGVSTAEVPPF